MACYQREILKQREDENITLEAGTGTASDTHNLEKRGQCLTSMISLQDFQLLLMDLGSDSLNSWMGQRAMCPRGAERSRTGRAAQEVLSKMADQGGSPTDLCLGDVLK